MEKILTKPFIWSFLVGILAAQPQVAVAAEESAEMLVRSTTEEVLEKLRADPEGFAQNTSRLFALVEETIFPHFDFLRMSRRVLGKYWETSTPEEQTEFVNQFQRLLLRTYATALSQYTQEDIKFLALDQREKEGEVRVRTEVTQGGGPAIPINYEMYLFEDAWKVFDISIDGVSLVINYRSTFRSEIKRHGMGALLQRLAEHNKGQ